MKSLSRLILVLLFLVNIPSFAQTCDKSGAYCTEINRGVFNYSLGIPCINGAPSGLPNSPSKKAGSVVWDSTNKLLYIYQGSGVWEPYGSGSSSYVPQVGHYKVTNITNSAYTWGRDGIAMTTITSPNGTRWAMGAGGWNPHFNFSVTDSAIVLINVNTGVKTIQYGNFVGTHSAGLAFIQDTGIIWGSDLVKTQVPGWTGDSYNIGGAWQFRVDNAGALTWTEVSSDVYCMQRILSGNVAAQDNTGNWNLYVFGGQKTSSSSDTLFGDVWRSRDKGKTWSRIATGLSSDFGMNMTSCMIGVGHRIFRFSGGVYSSGVFNQKCQVITDTNGTLTITNLANVPFAGREYPTISQFNDSIILFGFGSTNIRDCYFFNINTYTWDRVLVNLLPNGRHAMGATLAYKSDGTPVVYAMGGSGVSDSTGIGKDGFNDAITITNQGASSVYQFDTANFQELKATSITLKTNAARALLAIDGYQGSMTTYYVNGGLQAAVGLKRAFSSLTGDNNFVVGTTGAALYPEVELIVKGSRKMKWLESGVIKISQPLTTYSSGGKSYMVRNTGDSSIQGVPTIPQADIANLADSFDFRERLVTFDAGVRGRYSGSIVYMLAPDATLSTAMSLNNGIDAAWSALIVKGNSGQTADIFKVTNSSNVKLASIDKDGNITGNNLYRGTGSPEGVVTAPLGAFYQNDAGGAGTTFYVKETAPTGNTGWVGK